MEHTAQCNVEGLTPQRLHDWSVTEGVTESLTEALTEGLTEGLTESIIKTNGAH